MMRAILTVAQRSFAPCLVTLAAIVSAYAQIGKVKVIYEFNGSPSVPYSIAEYAPGQFVGGTDNFTPFGNVVYQIDTAGHYNIIATLTGTNAIGYVGPMENGKLFGYWANSKNTPEFFYLPGSGGQFQFRPNPNQLGPVYQWPYGVWGPGGFFYSAFGYVTNNVGSSVIGRMDMSGKLETLYTFAPSEGYPSNFASFAMTSDGTFYGENQASPTGPFFVWKVSPSGVFTQLATLPNPGAPFAPLVVTEGGTVYGAEAGGGTYKTGEIYKITPSGRFSVIAEFPKTGMSNPSTLMFGADGNIYGSTHTVDSFIFRLNTTTEKLEQIASSVGWQFSCVCQMIQGSDGKLYGTSQNGGPSGGGMIFSIDVGIAPPQPRLNRLGPSSGTVGTEIELWGANFLGASAVSFNGVPVPSSDIFVPTPNAVIVHVPPGATSGPVQLTTPNGTSVSTESFTVQ